MNQSTYDLLPGLNHSGMKWLEKSPAHYRAWKSGLIGESSPAMSLGIAIHCAVLEPKRFKTDYVSLPDTSHLPTPAKKAALTKSAKQEFEGTDIVPGSYVKSRSKEGSEQGMKQSLATPTDIRLVQEQGFSSINPLFL